MRRWVQAEVTFYVLRFTFYAIKRFTPAPNPALEPGTRLAFSYESLTTACNVSLNCATSLSWARFTSASVSVRSAAR